MVWNRLILHFMLSTVRNRLAYKLKNKAIIKSFECDSNHIYIPYLPFELPSDSQKRLMISRN